MAKIIHRKSILAQCTFLIVPIEQTTVDQSYNTDELIESDFYTGSSWNVFASTQNEILALEQQAIADSRRVGLDMMNWIDGLVHRFFVVKSICVVDHRVKIMFGELPICRETNWSSMGPDPKSDIYLEFDKFV